MPAPSFFYGTTHSDEDSLHDFAVRVRQVKLAALHLEGQSLVVETEQMQDGGVLVVNVHSHHEVSGHHRDVEKLSFSPAFANGIKDARLWNPSPNR